MLTRIRRRLALAGLIGASMALVPVGAALADVTGQVDGGRDLGKVWVLNGDAVVEEGDVADHVFVANGNAWIAGISEGGVYVLNGDVAVTGAVEGHVTAFNGRVTVESGAVVDGDVVSRERARIASDATVEGGVDRLGRFAWGLFGLGVLTWFAVSISTLVLGLLMLLIAPRVAMAAREVVGTAARPAVLWGIVVGIGLPIAAMLLAVTIVGLPLGIAVLLGLMFTYMLGYVASAFVLGRRIVAPPRSVFLGFIAGWAILRALALIPALGFLITTAATIFGLGLLVVALWRARPRERSVEPVEAAAA